MVDLAWVGGVFDMKARFAIPRRGHVRTHWQSVPINAGYKPKVQIGGGVEETTLREVQQLLGGHVSRPDSMTMVWSATGATAALHATNLALPYMRRQRQLHRASAFMRVCRQIVDFQREGFEQRALPLEEMEVRESCGGPSSRLQS